MTLTPVRKALLAYGLITLLALALLWWQLGGILPGLLLMGVVMGLLHLVALRHAQAAAAEEEEPPCDRRL